MQRRANLDMFLVIACGVDAVCKKNHKNLAIGIDPNGCAGETGVAERVRTEEMALLPPSVGAAQPSVRVPLESC